MWESAEFAQRHRVARMGFLERMTSVAGVEVEEILDFQVMHTHFGSALAGSVA